MRARALAIAGLILTTVLAGSAPANGFGRLDQPRETVFQVRGWGEAPGFGRLTEAASIEWVTLAAPTGSDCTRSGGLSRKERDYWTSAYAWNAFVATGIGWPLRRQKGPVTEDTIWCGDTPMLPPVPIMRARVIERFRGSGPLAFPLMIRWTYFDGREIWTPFKPDNGSDMFGPVKLGEYPRAALDGHRSLGFYDHAPVMSIPRESVLDGLGDPVADVRLRWLVVRDSRGAVMAMTPVARADDDLLVRLRKAGGDPRRFEPPSYPLDDFLREARWTEIVRVTGCRRSERKALLVTAVRLSGDPEAARMSWYSREPGPPTLDWIGDYLDATGQACRPGDSLLILARTFADRSANPGFPRAAIIRDGRIRKAALLTGLRLIGPDEIGVDRAQQLAAEGRARLKPAAW